MKKSIWMLLCFALLMGSILGLSACGAEQEEHIHGFGEWSVVKDATCAEVGKEQRLCSCGDSEVRDVALLAHVETIDREIAPTCAMEGRAAGSHCSVCGEVIVKCEVIEKLPHTEVVDEAVDATCTSEGKTEGSHCTVCSEITVKQETVEKLPHTETVDKAIAPTCAKEGKTEGSHCSVCGEITVKQEVVQKLTHTEVVDKAIAPTCAKEGKTEGSHCSVCGEVTVKQEVVKKIPHTEEKDVGIAATCTSEGKTDGSHCTVCGEVTVKQTVIKKLPHTEVTDKGIAATCTSTGKTDGKHCSVCNTVTVKQTVTQKLPHSELVTSDYKEATCYSSGMTAGRECTVCGLVISVPTVIEQVDHGYGTWVVTEYATTETSGTRYRSCKWCEKTENGVIDPIRYDGALGSAGKISETTVVVSIFADDSTTEWNFDSQTDKSMMDTMLKHLASAATWLEAQCGNYGAQTSFIYDWKENPDLFYTMDFGYLKMVRPDSGGFLSERTRIRNTIDSEELKQRYNAQNIIYIFYFNTDETNTVNSWCLSDVYGNSDEEVINIFVRDTYDTGGYYLASASTFAHEILHCFGAYDLYYSSAAIPKAYVDYCKSTGSRDIMYTVNNGATITPKFTQLCAYYVGLVDSCSEVEKWGLKKNSHLS